MSNYNTPTIDHLWGHLMDACKESGIHFSSANKVFELLPEFKKFERDTKRLETLRKLMGYPQNGSHTTLQIYQDDASEQITIMVDDEPHYGNSLEEILDRLTVEEQIPF